MRDRKIASHPTLGRSSGLALLLAAMAVAQAPDPGLLAEIRRMPAIDNHAHPPRVVAPGEKDGEFDALPCDPLEPTQPNTMTRPENPMYLAAWKALWGYSFNDRSDAHLRSLITAKERIRQQQGDHYPAWLMDHLGIEIELANRVAMGRGLDAAHFRWVPFADPLLFPLDNSSLAKQSPDRKFFFSRETALAERYRKESGVTAMPATLRLYLSRVVTPTLERQKRQGAVAIKFEAAYLRALDFRNASEADAAAIYERYAGRNAPPDEQYTRLQDFLLHYVSAEAGRLGLAVQFHTGAGCGRYFKLAGSDPTLLEPSFDDPQLRKTAFVLLHGGSVAFTHSVSFLMMRPNVYADLSEQTWLTSPRQLSQVLRDWLEWYPEKVLFGTDLYPGSGAYDWEEIGWQTNETARTALAIALAGMIQDGEITRDRALAIARMVLAENAQKLYGFSAASPARK
jgi:hypothetical protein